MGAGAACYFGSHLELTFREVFGLPEPKHYALLYKEHGPSCKPGPWLPVGHFPNSEYSVHPYFRLNCPEVEQLANQQSAARDRAFTVYTIRIQTARCMALRMQLMQHIHALKLAWINLVRFQVRCAPSNLVLCKLRAAFTWVSGYCTNFKLYGCRHA